MRQDGLGKRLGGGTYTTELADCGRFAGLVGFGTGLFGIRNEGAPLGVLGCLAGSHVGGGIGKDKEKFKKR